MSHYKYLFYILFCWITTANSQNFQIDHWSLEEGLSNSVVNHIHQDKWGIMWFATEHGLNRFNGYEFKIYRYNPFDSHSIGANYVEEVFESPNGDIYAILSVGGLSKLNRHSDKFTYYTYKMTGGQGNNFIQQLIWDEKGNTYASTFKGFNRINENTRRYELLQPDTIVAPSLQINSIWQLDTATFFLGSQKGLFYYNQKKDSLSWAQYPWRDSIHHTKYQITNFYKDKKNRLWIQSKNGGIFLYEENEKLLKPFWKDIDPSLNHWQNCTTVFEFRDTVLAAFKGLGLYFFDEQQQNFARYPKARMPQHINWAFPDSDKGFWIIGNSSRLFYIENQKCRPVFFDKINQKKNTINIRDAYQDREGNIWLATRGHGIYCVQPRQQQFGWMEELAEAANGDKHQLFVNEILETKNKEVWIGTDNGILIYHPSIQSFDFLNYEKDNSGLLHPYISALTEDYQGQIWIGTNKGVSIFNTENRSLKHYVAGVGGNYTFNSIANRAIYEDWEKRIWLCASNGLFLYHPEVDTFSHFHHHDHPKSLAGYSIRNILQTDKNTYWVGNISLGLNLMTYFPEQDSISCESFMLSDEHEHSGQLMTINALYEDEQKQLWVGTYSRGLLKFDNKNRRLVSVFPNEKPIPNIAAIVPDDKDNFWISANNGLHLYRPNSHQIQHFENTDGLQSKQFSIGAYEKGSDGKIYFGGVNGVNAFYPDEIQASFEVSPPMITGLKKFGEPLFFDQPLREMEKIELNYKDNFFSISFLSLNYGNAASTQYAYQLEGFDEKWVHCGNQRFANYTNLSGGDYIFKVKAGNIQGNWNEQIATLKISIHPPFWQTNWFYVLNTALLLGLFFLIYRLRWQIKMNQIRELEKVREKAAADFHDELGHRLTKIALFTETIFKKNPNLNGDVGTYLHKIRANSNELYHSLRDFVWAMNPRKDSVIELAILLKDFGDELFDNTGIHFRTEGIDNIDKPIPLEMDWKRHIVLIFKEAMHNALKHANCKNVTLSFSVKNSRLKIELIDDGKGFSLNEKYQGYGIGNMRKRAEKIGGQLKIGSQIKKGSQIQFEGKIAKKRLRV